jgi:hypothetical protein
MLFDIALVAPRLGVLGSQFDRRRPGRPGAAAWRPDIDSFFANSDGVRGLVRRAMSRSRGGFLFREIGSRQGLALLTLIFQCRVFVDDPVPEPRCTPPIQRAPGAAAAATPSFAPNRIPLKRAGYGGQQAAPAGHAADRPRSGRRGPRARESMDKEEEREPPTLGDRHRDSLFVHVKSNKNGRVHVARLPCLRLSAAIRLNPRIIACREAGRLSGSSGEHRV